MSLFQFHPIHSNVDTTEEHQRRVKRHWYRLCMQEDICEISKYFEENSDIIERSWLYSDREIEYVNDWDGSEDEADSVAALVDEAVDDEEYNEDEEDYEEEDYEEEEANSENTPRLSILSIASRNNNLPLVKFLVSEGFDPHIGLPNALIAAEEEGNSAIVEYLLDIVDIDVNLQDQWSDEHEAPSSLAASYGRIDRFCYYTSQKGCMANETDLSIFWTLASLRDSDISHYLRRYFTDEEEAMTSTIPKATPIPNATAVKGIQENESVSSSHDVIPTAELVNLAGWSSSDIDAAAAVSTAHVEVSIPKPILDVWGLYDCCFLIIVVGVAISSIWMS